MNPTRSDLDITAPITFTWLLSILPGKLEKKKATFRSSSRRVKRPVQAQEKSTRNTPIIHQSEPLIYMTRRQIGRTPEEYPNIVVNSVHRLGGETTRRERPRIFLPQALSSSLGNRRKLQSWGFLCLLVLDLIDLWGGSLILDFVVSQVGSSDPVGLLRLPVSVLRCNGGKIAFSPSSMNDALGIYSNHRWRGRCCWVLFFSTLMARSS